MKAGKRPGDEDYGFEPASSHGLLTIDKGGVFEKSAYFPNAPPETYGAFYKQFVEALQGDAKVPVSAEDGANVIKLVELVKQSSTERRTLSVD